ncbi:MAG: glycosyltransferase family 2 protein [Nanoarchaeota archaeon]|nr:glycosyltransferase family 2 protein [Nanoarchaeota archaeon]
MEHIELSIVIPCYNEGKNVYLLYQRIKEAMRKIGKSYEIIYVDDGSHDDTLKYLKKVKNIAPNKTVIVKLRKNFGQTAALDAGFKQAKGKVFITMDGDLQNDPADIPKLLKKMATGYDVVSGWRHARRDPFGKKIFSKMANSLRKSLTKEKIHDSGCSLKAYKRECFEDLNLYGEMHRYIPAILMWKGYRIGEVKVKHYARKYGKTKYNSIRLFKGFMDLLVVKFWMQFSGRPMHLFGGLGAIVSFLGFIIGLYLVYLKIFYKAGIMNRPLLLLVILLLIIGVQFLMFGIFGDILIKTYYDQKPGSSYSIEKIM